MLLPYSSSANLLLFPLGSAKVVISDWRLPMATEASPLKLDDLLTPYPYMGMIKGNEDTIARTLVGMKPKWEATLANS